MHDGSTGVVQHNKWPLCVYVDERSILPEICIINIDEGIPIQILETHKKELPRYVCWHEELLVLIVGFEDFFDVWTLEHDARYFQLLDEGIAAPSFETSYEEYYTSILGNGRSSDREYRNFGVADILGANHRRRLNTFWSNRYSNLQLKLFKRVDLSQVHGEDAAVLKSLSWLDHNNLVIRHSSNSRGTFLTIWKFQFESFNIDVYKEILSRRRFEEDSCALLNDLENVYIEILTGVDSRPILEQELSFAGPRIDDLRVAFDHSERFIIVYQHLDNELFIWRYEHSENDNQVNTMASQTRVSEVFPSQFQYQKISLKHGEEIIQAAWKPCSSRLPYKIKRLGGISELSAFSVISRSSEEIIVRIWRESSLNKPCKFVQALYLRLNNRSLVRNEGISLIWESFRSDVVHHFISIDEQVLDKSIKDLSTEIQDPCYYYSACRFPLIEEDDDGYLYSNLNSDYGEELSTSSIPLNSCIHNSDIFMMNEKQSKKVKLIVLIGREIFCFNVFQLDVWNDEVSSSISKWEALKFNTSCYCYCCYSSLKNSGFCDKNDNVLPHNVSRILFFWENDKLSSKLTGRIYNFILQLKDSNIAEYILNEKTGTWNLLKLVKITPNIHSNVNTTPNLHGKLAVELTNTNETLILLNNGQILLLDNLSPKKLFTFLHANKSACQYPHAHTCNNVDNVVNTGMEKNNDVHELEELGIENIINISEGIVSSYYQILLVKLNGKGNSQLGVFGLTSVCEDGSSTLDLLEVEINLPEEGFQDDRFDSVEGVEDDDGNGYCRHSSLGVLTIHEEILGKLFNPACKNTQYEVVFLDKHSSVIGGYCICICLVRDLVLEINHIIMFEIQIRNQESLLIDQMGNLNEESRMRLELKVLSPPMFQKITPCLDSSPCFIPIKLPGVDNFSLIFISSRVFTQDYVDNYQELHEKEDCLGDVGQIYIYICKLSDCQDNRVCIVSRIRLNKSLFDFERDSLLIDSLDYNLLIYNSRNGEMLCYSLLSLNMLKIEEAGEEGGCSLSLSPFQEISLFNYYSGTQVLLSRQFSNESVQDFKMKEDERTMAKSGDSQLVIVQDFEMTYFCFLIVRGKIVKTIYWNKDVCRWEPNEEINVYEHFQMSSVGELVKIQRMDVFDGLYLFFNTFDKIVPRVFRRPDNKVYEKANSFSFREVEVLEDFVFSLNDRKQLFSRGIFEKMNEGVEGSPNMNIRPYEIYDNSLRGSDYEELGGSLSLDNLGEDYQRLYSSLVELRLSNNNKYGSRMSVVEFEEYHIKRYFIRKSYFDIKRSGGFVLKSEDICWISLCEKDHIMDRILGNNGDGTVVDWKGLKSFGVIYILTEANVLEGFVERWVQRLYQRLVKTIAERRKELSGFEFPGDNAGDSRGGGVGSSKLSQDEVLNIVLIIYTCLNKLNIVSAIFKILDQKNVFDFLLNYNVDDEELRRQAVKNGYYLIKQRNYYWSLCFFILSRSYEEITNVCIKYLNDPQLLLLLLKLLMSVSQANEGELSILVNLYNKHLNDLWLLSLVNKDPWLSIIAVLNYSSVNGFKFSNVGRADVLQMIQRLSSPTTFFRVCEVMDGIEAFFKTNVKVVQEESGGGLLPLVLESSDQVAESCCIGNQESYDLSYSFIHPEHLFSFNNYVGLKLSICCSSLQTCDLKAQDWRHNPSFENVIEVISYYIKKCMNPYHYISWLAYIEKNNVLSESRHNQHCYRQYYEFIVKPNIINRIQNYVRYLHVNYYYFFSGMDDNSLLDWFNQFSSIPGFISKFHLNSNQANPPSPQYYHHCPININPINIFNYLLLINVDKYYFAVANNSNTGVHTKNDVIAGKTCRMHVACRSRLLEDFCGNRGKYLSLILQIFLDRTVSDLGLYLWNGLFDFFSRVNNDVILTFGCAGRFLGECGTEERCRVFLAILRNYIQQDVVELLLQLESRTSAGDGEREGAFAVVKLLKAYMVMVMVHEIVLRMSGGLCESVVSGCNELVKILKFVIVLKSYQRLRLHLRGSLSTRSIATKVLKLSRVFLEFSREYGYSRDFRLGGVADGGVCYQTSRKTAMCFNSILVVLSTGVLKVHQDLMGAYGRGEVSGRRSLKVQLGLALRKSYHNRVLKEWREIVVPLLPFILAHYYDSVDERTCLLFTRIPRTTKEEAEGDYNASSVHLRSGGGAEAAIMSKIVLVLEQIWVGMGIRNWLLLNILRNKELVVSYSVGSVSNLYHYLLRKVWNFREDTFKSDFGEGSHADSSSVELESGEQFSVSLLVSAGSSRSSGSGGGDSPGFQLEKLKLDFSNQGFGLSGDEGFKFKHSRHTQRKEGGVFGKKSCKNPWTSSFMLNMSVYNHRVIPTPRLNLVPTYAKSNRDVGGGLTAGSDTTRPEYVPKTDEDDDFYYYDGWFEGGSRRDAEEDSSTEDEMEDYYYKWYKNRLRKEAMGGLSGSLLLSHLLYQESPMLVDCKLDAANNGPFLLLGENTHLMLNSKLYFMHPASFARGGHMSSSSYEELVFQSESERGEKEGVFGSQSTIRLEALLSSFLLRRLLAFGRLEESQNDSGLLSYKRFAGFGSGEGEEGGGGRSSPVPSSGEFRDEDADVDFCVNIKKNVKSAYLYLHSPRDREEDVHSPGEESREGGGAGGTRLSGVAKSRRSRHLQEICFLQIFMDIPLSFSKIRSQFSNVKAIICGEAIQLRSRKISHIVYPYWSHSLAFSNYHKVASLPSYLTGGSSHLRSSKSNPKPIMISNSLSNGASTNSVCCSSWAPANGTRIQDSSKRGGGVIGGTRSGGEKGNQSQGGGGRSSHQDYSAVYNKVVASNSSNSNLGNITHVGWSPSKVHIILSTSNGFIMIYKLNSCGSHHYNDSSGSSPADEEDEIFLSQSTSGSGGSHSVSCANVGISSKPVGGSTDNVNSNSIGGGNSTLLTSGSGSNPNPFVPIFTFQVHKSSCYWSGFIDHACRYILTSGNGINFVYSCDSSNSNSGIVATGGNVKREDFASYSKHNNSRGGGASERTVVPVVGSNINVTTTATSTVGNASTTQHPVSSPSDGQITIGGIAAGAVTSSGTLINKDTLNLAEFMGDNTLNLNSKIEIYSVLSDENCLCIWDIWTNLCYNLALITKPDLLIALESSPVSETHNWKSANALLIVTGSGGLWLVSYLLGRQNLRPSLFKLCQKNVLASNLAPSTSSVDSKLTVISSDGTCVIYRIFLSVKPPSISRKQHAIHNHQTTIVPIIKFNINHSVSMNPLNIINNSLSSNPSSKTISHAIFINSNTLLVIDSLQNCKVIQLLPFFH